MSEWTNIEFTFVITKQRLDGLNEYKIIAFDNHDNEYSQAQAEKILEESCEPAGGRWEVLTPAMNIAEATYISAAWMDSVQGIVAVLSLLHI